MKMKRAPYVVSLGDASWHNDLVGGKGRGLYDLWSSGFAVPPAFCVTTEAFDAMVAKVERSVSELSELRESFRTEPFPAGLKRNIEKSLADLDADSVAVRSSAVREDKKGQTFAGQQVTRLGVSGPEEVFEAIRQVWASLYDVSSLVYRERIGVEVVPVSTAVVIQRMVDASRAGVLFTDNPVTAGVDEFVIDAVPGVGTNVVEGRDSETYFVQKSDRSLRRFEGDESSKTLDRGHLDKLCDLGERIESEWPKPQDVEWAYAAGERGEPGKLYVLQMRPAAEFESSERQKVSVWSNANVGEALPGVATPLTWSIIRSFSRRGFEHAFGAIGLSVPEDYELVDSFRGRVYLNLSQFMSVASGVPLLSADTLSSIAGGGGVEAVKQYFEKRSPVEFLCKLPVTIPRILFSQTLLPVVAEVFEVAFDYWRDALFCRQFERLDRDEFVDEIESVDELFDLTGVITLGCSSNFLMSYVLMREFLRFGADREATEYERALVSGLDVESSEPGNALMRLGRIVRNSKFLRQIILEKEPEQILEILRSNFDKPEVQAFFEKLADFRDEFGHRAPREAEISTPRWRDDERFLFKVLESYVRAAHLPDPGEREREAKRREQRAENLVLQQMPFGVKTLFRMLLGLTRDHARRREQMRSKVVETLDLYRKVVLEVGRRMVAADVLEKSEDAFFLRYDELRAWLDTGSSEKYRVTVMVRRAMKEAFEDLPDPPHTFILRNREIVPADKGSRPDSIPDSDLEPDSYYRVLEGISGCTGRATGKARVIRDPTRKASIEPGEILVAPHTDIGWTPLFLTTSAVVTGLGGPLSHSCIVAREYGVPTVVNVENITEIVETGDLITVDGQKGLVYLSEKQ